MISFPMWVETTKCAKQTRSWWDEVSNARETRTVAAGPLKTVKILSVGKMVMVPETVANIAVEEGMAEFPK